MLSSQTLDSQRKESWTTKQHSHSAGNLPLLICFRSVAYLAPEMLRRSGHGKSVDWYLLGVLLYELLVGAPPYYSPNRYVDPLV
jgi:serine/threonine protein kinase